MLIHLVKLLIRSLAAIPTTLGSTWFGILFAVAVILIGEVIALQKFGRKEMIANWKRTTGIGLAALGVGYMLVFLWCVITTTFQDHISLAKRVTDLRSIIDADAVSQQKAVSAATASLNGLLADLKQQCAVTVGAKEALTKQVSDQQKAN